MQDLLEELISILDQLLDLVTEARTPKSKILSLYNILSNRQPDNSTQDSIRDYVDLELGRHFVNLKVTDPNIIPDVGKWTEFLEFKYAELGGTYYAVALQVVLSLMSNSFLNKQQVAQHTGIKQLLLLRLEACTEPIVESKLTELYSQVLSVNCNPQDLLYLYAGLPECRYPFFHILNDLAEEVSDPYSQCYLAFENCGFQHALEPTRGALTVSIWIELLSLLDQRLLVLGEHACLEVRESLLLISRDGFTMAFFDMFDFLLTTLYHITLVFDGQEVSLYVDGCFIQTVLLPDVLTENAAKVKVGSDKCSFKLYRMFILKGVMHAPYLQTLNRTMNISAESPSIYQQKMLEHDVSGGRDPISQPEDLTADAILEIEAHDWILNKENDEGAYTITFPSENDCQRNMCFYYKCANILSCMETINALRIVMYAITRAEDIDYLFNCLKHLFILLRNPYLRGDFENKFDYGMLSTLLTRGVLRRLNDPINIDFLNLILEYCTTNTNDPSLIVINNKSAYKHLVLNLELWMSGDHKTPEVREAVRFLLFQLDWLQNSNHRHFNRLQLTNLRLLETFTIQQHLLFTRDSEDNLFLTLSKDVISFYASLLELDMFPKYITSMMYFSFYELNCGYYQSATLVLKAVDTLFSKVLETEDRKKIGKLSSSLSVKVLMILLDAGSSDEEVVLLVMSLLLKHLLSKRDIQRAFAKSGGYTLLFSILKDIQSGLTGKVTNLLCTYAFGNHIVPTHSESTSLLIRPQGDGLQRIVFELHYLAIALLEIAVIKAPKEDQQELSKNIITYINELALLHSTHSRISLFDPSVCQLHERLLTLLLTLTDPKYQGFYIQAILDIELLLSNNIFFHLKNDDPPTFSNYLQNILVMKGTSDLSPSRLQVSNKRSNYIETTIIIKIVPHVIEKLVACGTSLNLLFSNNPSMLKNIVRLFTEVRPSLCTFEFEANTYLIFYKSIMAILEAVKSYSFIQRRTANLKNLTDFQELNMYMFLEILSAQKTNLATEQWRIFLKSLLFYQEALFSQSQGHFEKEFAACIILFLVNCIQQSVSDDLLSLYINVLRTVILHHDNRLKSLSNAISRQQNHEIKEILAEMLVSNDEEVLDLLCSFRARSIFTPLLSSYIQNNLNKKVPSSERRDFMPASKVHESLLKMKQHYIENRLLELQKLHQLFCKDNVNFSKKMINVEERRIVNLLNDLDDDANFTFETVHTNFVNNELFMELHDHKSVISRVWTLDTAEDCNRMKKRLTTIYNSAPRLFSGSSCPILNVDPTATMSRVRNSLSSVTSYCVVTRFDSLKLSDLESEDNNRKVLKSLKEGDTVKQVWNCTIVVGLKLYEGILVMGNKYLYFIKNYFFSARNKVVMNIEDAAVSERDMTTTLITGAMQEIEGTKKDHEITHWDLTTLAWLIKRPFLLRDVGIELIFEHGNNCFFSFANTDIRDDVYRYADKLPRSHDIDPVLFETLEEVNKRASDIGCRNGISTVSLSAKFASVFSPAANLLDSFDAISLWRKGYISNFYYLMIINTLAGRTFNDLTQYPVFPWVIADYTSEELDFEDPSTFRDLTKPMGAQDRDRMQKFVERYNALSSLDDPSSPPFHYGTHYSSAMIVSSYLIRLEPFAKSYLLLQGGKFGPADRLFNSIERTWKSASKESTTDVRELTPEFYYLPDFLQNINDYDFGCLQSGDKVGDVILPPWAKGDPKIFISKNREALESKYVSEHLHQWIDLIFGYKQKGLWAIDVVNVFNRLSYSGAVNLDRINDENERRAVTGIIHNFGQTPLQLFHEPHPIREFNSVHCFVSGFWEEMRELPNNTTSILSENANRAVKLLEFERCDELTARWIGFPHNAIKVGNFRVALHGNTSINICGKIFKDVHNTKISCLASFNEGYFITGDAAGLIKIWNFFEDREGLHLKLLNNCYGHINGIHAISATKEYSAMLSCDMHGCTYMWDLSKGDALRTISRDAKCIAVSNSTSHLMVVDISNNVHVYDLNGSKFASMSLTQDITAISFVNFASQEMSRYRHMYWKEKDIIVLGFIDGTVCLYVLELKNGTWCLNCLKKLRSGRAAAITALGSRVKLASLNNGSPKYVDILRVEISAGNTEGDIFTWK
ncbi:AFR620Wp [Eremothecium gossypii ATCC 10895]|uniref:Beige protein homolog 1 n=1 Tax=Eremothecium gossypii (strain ATCC 10895 / CBS 109.51 / FGSC 9923 / NRRL Y-1056) TaxID=284811 RepID=Q752F6_EREGS|nr:AFR620Wp [Eremothecium gossypii ATCC 10895]AAS53991.2 AFR620Wp [Eremothecium gossypii ATCC 10895]AEY98305.1 FAFR620Wp [Eremothecium gossypii FDAG1]